MEDIIQAQYETLQTVNAKLTALSADLIAQNGPDFATRVNDQIVSINTVIDTLKAANEDSAIDQVKAVLMELFVNSGLER